MVPKVWDRTTLEGLIEIKHGFAFKSEFFKNAGHYVVLTPGNFHEEGGFRDQGNKTKYYSDEIPKDFILSKNDLLLAMTEQAEGLLGSAAFVPQDNKYLHNQRLGLVKIKDKSKLESAFLYYVYNSKVVRKQISETASGTKVKHTSPERLTGVVTLLPPISEQIKIAQILSAWDKAITQTRQLIDARQGLKRGLMQQLLTGKARFSEFGPPSKNGELPLGWEYVGFKKLFKLVKRKNTQGRQRVLTASGEFGLVDQQTFFNRNVSGLNLEKYYHIYKGEFAYNRSAMKAYPFGAIKRLDTYEEGIVSTLYICFSAVDEKQVSTDFYAHYFEAGLLNNGLAGITQVGGRAHGLLNVTNEDFLSLKVLKPPFLEQIKIAKTLNAIESELKFAQNQLKKLERQKQGLMQKLLTGQVRVKVEA